MKHNLKIVILSYIILKMKFSTLALTAVTYLNSASGEFFLKENFNDDVRFDVKNVSSQ